MLVTIMTHYTEPSKKQKGLSTGGQYEMTKKTGQPNQLGRNNIFESNTIR